MWRRLRRARSIRSCRTAAGSSAPAAGRSSRSSSPLVHPLGPPASADATLRRWPDQISLRTSETRSRSRRCRCRGGGSRTAPCAAAVMVGTGASRPVRSGADGTRNSGENEDASRPPARPPRSPERSPARRRRHVQELTTFIAATLTECSIRAPGPPGRPPGQGQAAAAPSPVVGPGDVLQFRERRVRGRPTHPADRGGGRLQVAGVGARSTMVSPAACTARARSSCGPASTASAFRPPCGPSPRRRRPSAPARLLTSPALRSNSTAASWPVRSVPSMITTSQCREHLREDLHAAGVDLLGVCLAQQGRGLRREVSPHGGVVVERDS